MPSKKPNQLIVEGHDDKHCVISLMAAHVPWPDGAENAPVHVELGNSVDEILRDGYLSAMLKSNPIKNLGVMIDADENAKGRYSSIRKQCISVFPGLPEELPADGLVAENDGRKFGVWIMPDNATEGYLEIFLKHLVPVPQADLWKHAVGSVAVAVDMGAGLNGSQVDKANLYTWLSWQDPPGRAPGLAMMQRALDPHCDYAANFVSWFKQLYGL